jgi:hypothetical protein
MFAERLKIMKKLLKKNQKLLKKKITKRARAHALA